MIILNDEKFFFTNIYRKGEKKRLLQYVYISAVCQEGLKPCKDKVKCFSDSERCDNVSKCDDGTDEEGCCKYYVFLTLILSTPKVISLCPGQTAHPRSLTRLYTVG